MVSVPVSVLALVVCDMFVAEDLKELLLVEVGTILKPHVVCVAEVQTVKALGHCVVEVPLSKVGEISHACANGCCKVDV